MSEKNHTCALLADRHLGLAEAIRGLLELKFDAVIMVGDEASLQECAARLRLAVAVVDLSLTGKNGLEMVRQLHIRCPELKLILLSVHDEANACRAILKAGANAVVLKRTLTADLLLAIEAVQAGREFCSPDFRMSC